MYNFLKIIRISRPAATNLSPVMSAAGVLPGRAAVAASEVGGHDIQKNHARIARRALPAAKLKNEEFWLP